MKTMTAQDFESINSGQDLPSLTKKVTVEQIRQYAEASGDRAAVVERTGNGDPGAADAGGHIGGGGIGAGRTAAAAEDQTGAGIRHIQVARRGDPGPAIPTS